MATIPQGIIISDVTMSSEHRTYITESMNGKFKSRDSGIQRFSGKLTLTAGDGVQNQKKLNSFLMGLRGRTNTIQLQLGGVFSSDIIANPLLQVETTIGSDTITLSSNADLDAGSIFTFANEDKVYTLLDNVVIGVDTVVNIVPSVKKYHTRFTLLNFINPTITAILSSDTNSITYSESGFISEANLNWIEKY